MSDRQQAPSEAIRIVRVQITEDPSGLFYATSPDLPGLVVIERDRAALNDQIVAGVELLFQADGKTVEAGGVLF